MNESKFNFNDYCLIVTYTVILVFTFFPIINVNKVLAPFLIILIFLRLYVNNFKARKERLDFSTVVFFLVCLYLYIMQYVAYGILMNTMIFSLISFYLLVEYLSLINFKRIDFHIIVIVSIILFFTLITATEATGQYVFKSGAGGILSAFMLVAGFILSRATSSHFGLKLSLSCIVLLFIISIRGPLLIALLFFFFQRDLKVSTLIKAGTALVLILSTLYLIEPSSRIFQLHMSGRLIPWLSLIESFDYDKLLLGTGNDSSKTFLQNIGLGASMALPHNEFIRVFYELGVTGLFLLLLVLNRFIKASSYPMAYFSALFIPFFFDNAISYLFSFVFFIILSDSLIKQNNVHKYF